MIERDLNLVKLVKNLRDIKLHLQAKGIMTNLSKIKARNTGNNVIVLTNSDGDSSPDIELS